jgi:hypothetical protein
MRTRLVTLAFLAALGTTAPVPAPASADAPAAPVSLRARATPAREVLPFIEDDYARALAEARARGKPIFIEAWAPW